MLHSPHVRLVALWDEQAELVERSGGGAPGAAGRGRFDAAEPWVGRGWSDARPMPPSREAGKAEWAAAMQGRGAAGRGGRLSVDLEALLGPTHMHAGHTPTCRKEMYYLGEMPAEGFPLGMRGASGGAGAAPLPRSGIYLTLPMPFWRAARIQLEFTGAAGEEDWVAPPWADTPGAGAGGSEHGVEACWSVAVSRGGVAGYYEGGTGYLQGGTWDFDMEEGMAGNVMAGVAGQRGTFMLLSMYVRAAQKNFVEGDIRVWTDGSPTPVLWDSGFEDFFQGSHAYERVHHSCGEPFYSWDRAEPVNWNGGCPPDHPPCDMHFFQTRALLYDAVPFRSGFRVAIEGNPRTYHGRVRSAALWYGAASTLLATSDWVEPGVEGSGGGGAWGVHAYSVAGLASGDLQEYAVAATIPSMGESIAEDSVEGVSIGWPLGGAYPSKGGRVLTIDRVYRVPPGGVVSFTVRVEPGALGVHLRRLVDTRVGVQIARLWANGIDLGEWVSSDRHFGHLADSQWKVETIVLPKGAFEGRDRVDIIVQVEADWFGRQGRVYPPFHHGEGWTEARWEVLCEMPPP